MCLHLSSPLTAQPPPFPLSHALSSLWRPVWLQGQSGPIELRTASKPCCAGSGDGACGSAVVGLDQDAGLSTALLPLSSTHSSPISHALSSLWRSWPSSRSAGRRPTPRWKLDKSHHTSCCLEQVLLLFRGCPFVTASPACPVGIPADTGLGSGRMGGTGLLSFRPLQQRHPEGHLHLQLGRHVGWQALRRSRP